MSTSHTFHVHGMHCKSCVVLTETTLSQVEGVSTVKASLKTATVEVSGHFGQKEAEKIAEELNLSLVPHGYSLSAHSSVLSAQAANNVNKWFDFIFAIPFALLFISFFIVLQKIGLVNLVQTSSVNFGTAFFIGLIASVSTCVAVVGGLVLSLSANFAKEGDKFKPQLLFHVGRLISFFILGGVIGAIGSLFQFGPTATFILGILVAVILLILGLHLLDIFPWFKKIVLSLPSSVGRKVHQLKELNHTLTPFLVGAATFFLPCGFTQSMQLYTLTTGSFFTGALTMFSFALGTLPVLAVISFSPIGIHNKKHAAIFFKTVGLIVLFFGIFNLTNTFVTAGIIAPVFNF